MLDGAIFCLDCGSRVLADSPRDSGDRVSAGDISAHSSDAELAGLPDGAYLFVIEGLDRGRRYDLDGATALTLGRKESDISLTDPFVSRRHAEIELKEGAYVVIDQNSANCTLVNSRPVGRHTLEDGDLIEVGFSTILFRQK